MKTKPDPDQLLAEIFSETAAPAFREASLQRALVSVRRRASGRRVFRATLATAMVLTVAALFGLGLRKPNALSERSALASAPTPPAPTVPGTQIRLVGDDELRAMFPDRPVALVGPPEHRQFVFRDEPRPQPNAAPGMRTGVKL